VFSDGSRYPVTQRITWHAGIRYYFGSFDIARQQFLDIDAFFRQQRRDDAGQFAERFLDRFADRIDDDLGAALDLDVDLVVDALRIEGRRASRFRNQPDFKPAFVSIDVRNREAAAVDRDIALRENISFEFGRHADANHPVVLGRRDVQDGPREIDMAGQRMPADFRAVLRGPLHIDPRAWRQVGQRGDLQARQHHVEVDQLRRMDGRHRQAHAVDGHAGADLDVVGKPLGEFDAEGSQLSEILDGLDDANALDNSCKHDRSLVANFLVDMISDPGKGDAAARGSGAAGDIRGRDAKKAVHVARPRSASGRVNTARR